jgi:hypothetical protein
MALIIVVVVAVLAVFAAISLTSNALTKGIVALSLGVRNVTFHALLAIVRAGSARLENQ